MRILENDEGYNYGIVGDVTNLSYNDGEFMQVGDVVRLYSKGGRLYPKYNFVCKRDGECFVMGICGIEIINGESDDFIIEKHKKFYEMNVGDTVSDYLTIVQKEIKILELTLEQVAKEFKVDKVKIIN